MTVTRDIAATRERVWEVLANGWNLLRLGRRQQPHPRGGFELAGTGHPHSALDRDLAGGDQR